MTEHLQSRPLLRFGIFMIAGIAIGGMVDAPSLFALSPSSSVLSPSSFLLSPFKLSGIAVVLLLLAIVLLRRHEMLTSLLTSLVAFLLGIFLITNPASAPATVPDVFPSGSATIPEASASGTWLQQQREHLSSLYRQQGLSGDEYSVVAAMTLGEKQRVSRELKEVYSKTGASHVFALSGLHMGILFMLLTFITPSRIYRKTSLALQLLAIWMFVMLVGAHSSVVRAAVMLTIYSLCRISSRHPDSLSVLVLTAMLLLFIRPHWLFDIGFQMSFLAVLSIVLLYSPIYHRLPMPQYTPALSRRACRWTLSYLYGLIFLSITAQIGVAPLIAHYFGRFSSYFLLTNLLVTPCAFIIIALALLLFLLLLLAAPFGAPVALAFCIKCVATALAAVTSTLNTFLNWIATLPGSSIDGINLNTPQTFLIYLLIASLLLLLRLLLHRRTPLDREEYP